MASRNKSQRTRNHAASTAFSAANSAASSGGLPHDAKDAMVDAQDEVSHTPRAMVTDLSPSEVRWFYKNGSKDNKWCKFSDPDSLLIEVKWRYDAKRPFVGYESLVVEANSRGVVVLDDLYLADLTKMEVLPIYWNEHEVMPIQRGTWFYGPTWIPLETQDADLLEAEHMRLFRGRRLADVTRRKKRSRAVLTKTIGNDLFEATWYAADDVMMWNAKRGNSVVSLFRRHSKTGGTRLHRGYWCAATLDGKPNSVTRVMFVVHGIGSKRWQRILFNTASLRQLSADLTKKRFADISERIIFLPIEWRVNCPLDGDLIEKITPRHVLPLRRLLNLTLLDVLYYTSPLYRNDVMTSLVTELNDTYKRFLKYNPQFEAAGGQVSIIGHSLGSVLAYDVITEYSPITQYDDYVTQRITELQKTTRTGEIKELITTLQRTRDKLNVQHGLVRLLQGEVHRLKFNVVYMFLLGSPLGVFLTMRGFKEKQDIVPRNCCKAIFNIYHPCDAAAYRLEPLVLKTYEYVRPVRIRRWDASEQRSDKTSDTELYAIVHIAPSAPVAKEANMTLRRSLSEHLSASMRARNGTPGVVLTLTPQNIMQNANHLQVAGSHNCATLDDAYTESSSASISPRPRLFAPLNKKQKQKSSKQTTSMRNLGIRQLAREDKQVDMLALPEKMLHRLDYVLRQKKLDVNYVTAFTSHVGYWNNYDVVMFILEKVYEKHVNQDLSSSGQRS